MERRAILTDAKIQIDHPKLKEIEIRSDVLILNGLNNYDFILGLGFLNIFETIIHKDKIIFTNPITQNKIDMFFL